MFSTFANRMAQMLSLFLHPLLIPTLLFSLMATFRIDVLTPFNAENIYFLIVFVFIGTFLAPVLIISLLYFSKSISSLMLDEKMDRQKAMVASLLIYIGMAWMLYHHMKLNNFALWVFIEIVATMAVAIIITLFWKISLHSMGAAGLAMFCAFLAQKGFGNDIFYVFIGSILLGGILLSARLFLEKHTLAQIVAGYGLGIFVGGIGFFVNN